jgi:hypothetical protein
MKKLLLMMAIVMSSAVFASAQGQSSKAPETKFGTCEIHYYYKNHRLIACSGCVWKDQTENVKLANGTIITNKGEVASHHWTKVTKLKDGECVNLKGEIIDHKKAHDESL